VADAGMNVTDDEREFWEAHPSALFRRTTVARVRKCSVALLERVENIASPRGLEPPTHSLGFCPSVSTVVQTVWGCEATVPRARVSCRLSR
jgi:hypothetical protein